MRATFRPDRVAIPATTVVTFTASPGNMTSPTYQWDFADGNSGTGQRPTHTFGANGEYHVTVTARDSNGASADAFVDVAARDIVGRWDEEAVDNYKSEITLRQDGRQVTGTWESFEMMDGAWHRFENVPLDGELEDPDVIRITAHGFCGTHIEGHFDGEVNRLEAEITFTSGACDPDALYQRTFVRR